MRPPEVKCGERMGVRNAYGSLKGVSRNLGVGTRNTEKESWGPNSYVAVASVVAAGCVDLPFGKVAICPKFPLSRWG